MTQKDQSDRPVPESVAVPYPGLPFLSLLEIHPQPTARGLGHVELIVRSKHLRNLGIAHGGVAATLLDSAMGMAAGTVTPAGHYVVTAQLNVNFIRPAWEGETLIASGEIQHAGRQTAVARGEIRNAADTLVATGSATFLFVAHKVRDETAIERVDDATLNQGEATSS